jgi:hypothetical protein
MNKKNIFLLLLLFAIGITGVKGQVTIGALQEPKDFSVLELISNQQRGLRLPQMEEIDRDAIDFDGKELTDARGLQIFNLTTNCVDTWNGTEWISECDCNNLQIVTTRMPDAEQGNDYLNVDNNDYGCTMVGSECYPIKPAFWFDLNGDGIPFNLANYTLPTDITWDGDAPGATENDITFNLDGVYKYKNIMFVNRIEIQDDVNQIIKQAIIYHHPYAEDEYIPTEAEEELWIDGDFQNAADLFAYARWDDKNGDGTPFDKNKFFIYVGIFPPPPPWLWTII